MLYKLKSCFLVFFILLVTSSFAQKEGYQWAFGQSCGLSFLSGKPDTFSTGIDAFNGCASICTSLGDLLFYTNGFFVDFYKNKNRTCNPDFTIQGTTGNFQSAIFIPHPHPDSSNLYFVFSSRSANCNCKYDKLYYSVIDLSPCSTGYIKGFIKSRSDIQITKTAVCGKLTAVKHANRKDYWVASYLINTDTFFAVQVGNNGVSSKLIKSNTGVYYKNNYTVNSPMKFSPDGKKLSSTAIGEPSFIADFNSKTGKLNNIIIFDSIKYDVVEFSSKSKFLYAVSSYSHIDQFDVSKKNKIDFINSKIRIDTINRFDYLQLAPDGKIYVASEYSNYLNVIHAPDSAGVSCRYRKKFVKLPRALDGPGLPDMVQSFFQKKTFEYRRSCTRDTVFFAPSNTF
ncbi:MAG: hypothetical protein HUU47_07280, partial [Bacteroidetes bacterium]|nr:hypothetical protein [Bacteroidota bacterium]